MSNYVVGPAWANRWSYTGSNQTVGIMLKPLQTIKATSIHFIAWDTGTPNITGKIWVAGAGATEFMATTGVQAVTVSSNSTWYEVTLTTPVILNANTTYMISIFSNQNNVSFGSTEYTGQTLSSIPSGYTAIYENGAGPMTASGDAYPNTPWSGGSYSYATPHIRLGFSNPNDAPTATNLSPNTFRDNRSATNFTWTYSDTEGNAQNAYQIQYRVRGSTGAWTTVTGTTGTSHTFAANTFTLGQEYEWQVRVSDATAGYGAWSTLTYFVSGTSGWNYGPPVTTATQSGAIPGTFFSTDYEASDSLTSPVAWQNNDFFGTYTASTIARTTTRPKAGSYSMEITWPTGAESRACSSLVTGFTVGSYYSFKADVYVPAGSPNINIDPFLQTDVVGAVVTEKDQWVTREVTFKAASADIFFAFKTAGSTTGQKLFVDNVSVNGLTPSPGTYYVQARTSDLGGFGPWSESVVLEVTPPANPPVDINLTPLRVGGTINTSWFYSNSVSNAQTKYQIQYRRKS